MNRVPLSLRPWGLNRFDARAPLHSVKVSGEPVSSASGRAAPEFPATPTDIFDEGAYLPNRDGASVMKGSLGRRRGKEAASVERKR